MKTITPAPVRRSIEVKAPQALAFEVFTLGFGSWWPHTHTISKGKLKGGDRAKDRRALVWRGRRRDADRLGACASLRAAAAPDPRLADRPRMALQSTGAHRSRDSLHGDSGRA